MMRALIVGGVLVLVAALAWMLFGGRSAAHEADAAAVGRDVAPPAAAAPPEGGAALAPVDSRPVSAAPFVDEAPPPEAPAATETPTTILCLVKTHDGRPAAGATVAAFSATQSDRFAPIARFTADAQGRVTVADVAAQLRRDEVRVVATVPGLGAAECPSVVVTAGIGAGPPRTLTLPPTTALRVSLRSEDGRPYETDSDVRLAPDGEPQFDFDEGGYGAGRDGTLGPLRAGLRRTSNGAAEFPYVACGAELRVTAASSAPRVRRAAKTWRAPDAPGPRAEVELTLGQRALTVAGRVVDGEGKPRAGARLLVQPREPAATAAASMFGGADPVTLADDDGRFEATFDRDPAAMTASATRVKLAHVLGKVNSIETETPHGPPDASGRIELGDVALADAPTLLEGRVVDASGTPVPNALIRFFRKDEKSGRFAPDWFGAARFLCADTDGAFALRGVLAADARLPAFVGAVKEGYYLLEPAPLPATGPVTVRLARGGRVSGTFKKGPTADCAERFVLEVVSASAASESDLRKELDVNGAGFSEDGVPPGPARVVVRLKGRDAPLLEVDGIAVEAGAEVADPRLKDLDLSSHIGALRITITDEAGLPIPESGVSERAEGSWLWVERRADHKGVVTVPTAGAPARLIARAPGYAAADLGKPTADRVVALKRPIRCRVLVTLPSDIVLPAAPFGLSASLRWGGPDESSVDDGHAEVAALAPEPDGGAFGAERTLTLVVRAPGVYLLQPNVTQSDGDSRRAMHMEGKARVTVGPADKELRVELKMTQQEIASRIDEFRD